MVNYKIRLTAGTNTGLVRKNNEDNFVVCPELGKDEWYVPENVTTPIDLGSYGSLLVVADGMGGLNAGEVASAIAVETVHECFSSADLAKIKSDEKSIAKFLKNVIVEADASIKQQVKDNPGSKGMGTTLILVWVLDSRAHLAWCGDSRAYIYNNVSGLSRFSKDHSYVQELVDKGILDEDLAFDHPDSNIVTRSLGDFPEKARPEYKAYYLQDGDYVLLCSDGLCGYCHDVEIEEIMIETHDSIEECKEQLIAAALNAGGYDNITIALLEFMAFEGEESNSAPSRTLSDTVDLSEHGNTHNKAYWKIIVIILFLAVLVYYFREYFKLALENLM